MPQRQRPSFLRFLAPLSFAALLAMASLCCESKDSLGTNRTIVPVEKTSLDVTLEELGIVEATRTISVESPFGGRLVTILESGTPVSKGDVVAVLDTRDIEDRLADQIESLKSTKKQLEGVMEELIISLRNNLLDVSSANAQLDLARIELENVNLNLADLEYLHSQQLVSDDSVRDASSRMRRSQIQTLNQDMGLRSQVTGSISTEKRQEVRIERIGLQGQEMLNNIQESNERIERAIVRSPVDGLFIRHSRWNWQLRRNMERQAGENVSDGEALGRIPDLASLIIMTQVPEGEMLRVRRGLKVEVSFEALGNLRLPGEISLIAPLAVERETAPGGQVAATGDQISGEKVFEIEVRLLETDERLKPGLTARSRILLDRQENLLTIPIEAITTRNGTHTVRVMVDGTPVTRQVTIGRYSRQRAEVTSGLQLGDMVVVEAF